MASRSPSSSDGPGRTEQLVAALALWSHRHPKAVLALGAVGLGTAVVHRVLQPATLPWGLLIASVLTVFVATRVFRHRIAALLILPSLTGAVVGLGFAEDPSLELLVFALGIDQGFRTLPVVRAPDRSAVLESFRGAAHTVVPGGLAVTFGLAALALTQGSASLAVAAAAVGLQTLAHLTLLPALLGITAATWSPDPTLEERWPKRLIRWAPTLGWAVVLLVIAVWPHTEGALVTLKLSGLDVAVAGGAMLLLLALLRGLAVALFAGLAGFATVTLTTGALAVLDRPVASEQGLGLALLFGLSLAHGAHLAHRPGSDQVVTLRRQGGVVAQAQSMLAVALFAMSIVTPLGAQTWVLGLGLIVHAFVTLAAVPALAAMVESARHSEDKGGLLPRLAVTVGLAGDAPVGPGTLGALVAVPIGFALQSWGVGLSVLIAVALTALSIPITTRYLERTGRHDPSEVVLDELVGCLLAMVMVPFGLVWGWAAFGLFRLFDITKPGPVRWAERRAPGAWGVIGDDVIAGILAGAVLLGLRWAGSGVGWWA